MSARFDPPAVLTEGWAEANQGTDLVDQAARAWDQQMQGNDLSLRELIAPEWYDRHEYPAYVQGAALVNFLLMTFGPERFLELYTTCTRSSFEADCRRILGRDLDRLDASLRADIERLAEPQRSPAGRLRRLATGPKVARSAWEAFLDHYVPEAERLLQPGRDVRMTIISQKASTRPSGKTIEFSERIESQRTGEWCSLHVWSNEGEAVYLAHPRGSFVARRKTAADAWEIRESRGMTPERSYRRILSEIGHRELLTDMAGGLLTVAKGLRDREDPSTMAVVELTPFVEDDRRFIRVRLEDRTASVPPWREYTVVLAADDHFAVRSDEIDLSTGMKLTGEFLHDRHGELPVIHSILSSGLWADGTRTTSRLTVLERRFEPTLEAEFAREHLLAGAPVHTITAPGPYDGEPSVLMRWYRLPFAAGAVGLLLGAALRLRSGRSPGKSSAEPPGEVSPEPIG